MKYLSLDASLAEWVGAGLQAIEIIGINGTEASTTVNSIFVVIQGGKLGSQVLFHLIYYCFGFVNLLFGTLQFQLVSETLFLCIWLSVVIIGILIQPTVAQSS